MQGVNSGFTDLGAKEDVKDRIKQVFMRRSLIFHFHFIAQYSICFPGIL
jgi:hypothetical protein